MFTEHGTLRRPRWLAIIILMVLSLEGASFLALYTLQATQHIGYRPIFLTSIPAEHRVRIQALLAGRTEYLTYSPRLGWTIKPYGATALYRANSRGMRGTREYAPTPPADVVRISSFGNSFTHGSDVPNEATWQEALMRLDRRLEVLNFGVPAYGLDQAFLRYQQDGVMYRSHVVLIGILSESIFRGANVYRPFYALDSQLPLTKPRYVLEGGKAVLLENPLGTPAQYEELLKEPEPVLRRLAAHDDYVATRYQRGALDFLPSVRLAKIARSVLTDPQRTSLRGGAYATTSEPFKVTMTVLDLFVATVEKNGAVPVVVIFPHRGDLIQLRQQRTARNAAIVQHARMKGHRYVDLAEGFKKYGARQPLDDVIHSHYTALGNEIAARTIQEYLVVNRLVNLKGLSQK